MPAFRVLMGITREEMTDMSVVDMIRILQYWQQGQEGA